MKILVTGGAGFIGSHIVDAYIADGHDVSIIDDLSSGKKEFVHPKARFYEVDIRNRKDVAGVFEKERPEILNHHAAQISVRESIADPLKDASINTLGLLNLLEEGRVYGIKRVIFASSGGAIYGEAETLPTPETYTPLLPLSPYGIAKLSSELYLHAYQKTYGISFIALRYGNVYGPRQNPHGEAGVVAIFTLKLLSGQAPTINGDGLQTRDYVYVGDVVDANRKALMSMFSGAYNIGTGKETDVVALYEKIKRETGSAIVSLYGPAKKGEQLRSRLDTVWAKKTLAWEAKHTLDAGIRKTVDYFKNEEKK